MIRVYECYALGVREGHVVDVLFHGDRKRFTHVVSRNEAIEAALEFIGHGGQHRIVAVMPIGDRDDRFRVITESAS